MRNSLQKVLPEGTEDFVILFLAFAVMLLYVKYNIEILKFFAALLQTIGKFLNKLVGRRTVDFDKRMSRATYLGQNDVLFDFYQYYEVMTTNLDLKKEGVTSMGLFCFLVFSTLVITIAFTIIFNFNLFLFILSTIVIFYLLQILCRVLALTKTEEREKHIMDAVDTLCSDMSMGAKNAIRKYKDTDSFHPDIKPYFDDFCDNLDNKGYSFKDAMLVLNDNLGVTFCDFCAKAVLYEEKKDEELLDMFSSIISMNHQRRMLRQRNNAIFSSVVIQFLISFGMIVFYAVYSVYADSAIYEFLTQTTGGKVMAMLDIGLVAVVLYNITNLKAKSL